MELPVRAGVAGTVRAVHCREGELVQPGLTLIEVDEATMKVTIVEVGPRDGLQNESSTVSTADKVAFVDRLSAAGLPVIEVSAFVSPKWVPQMADAADVFAGITRRPGVRYAALVPNLAGLDRAHAAGVTEIAIFAAASETFSRRNINQSIDASLVDVPRRVRTGGGARCARARVRIDRVRVSVRGSRPAGSRSRGLSGTHRDGCVRGVGQRHDRHRAPRAGADCPRRGDRARAARQCRAPLPRYARNGARQCPDGAAIGRSRRSTRLPAGSAAARMRPGRPATSRPKI